MCTQCALGCSSQMPDVHPPGPPVVTPLRSFCAVRSINRACEDRFGTGPPLARIQVIHVDLSFIRAQSAPLPGFSAHHPQGRIPRSFIDGALPKSPKTLLKSFPPDAMRCIMQRAGGLIIHRGPPPRLTLLSPRCVKPPNPKPNPGV